MGRPAEITDYHPLQGLWIVHNHYGPVPWRYLMDLPEDEALRINALTANIRCGTDPVTGKEMYYQYRRNVEAWDRTQHIARGGSVESENPVYAALTNEQIDPITDDKAGRICFPAEWGDPKLISITFGESFPYYNIKDTALPSAITGRSLSAAEFAKITSESGMPDGYSFRPSKNSGTDFIEVRLFTRNIPTHEMVLNLTPGRPDRSTPAFREAAQARR